MAVIEILAWIVNDSMIDYFLFDEVTPHCSTGGIVKPDDSVKNFDIDIFQQAAR